MKEIWIFEFEMGIKEHFQIIHVREAFIKKKKSVFFTVGGGGSKIKNFTGFKVMFKIHFMPF